VYHSALSRKHTHSHSHAYSYVGRRADGPISRTTKRATQHGSIRARPLSASRLMCLLSFSLSFLPFFLSFLPYFLSFLPFFIYLFFFLSLFLSFFLSFSSSFLSFFLSFLSFFLFFLSLFLSFFISFSSSFFFSMVAGCKDGCICMRNKIIWLFREKPLTLHTPRMRTSPLGCNGHRG